MEIRTNRPKALETQFFMTIPAIAAELGLSHQRVNQIIQRSLLKIKVALEQKQVHGMGDLTPD